VPIPGHSSSGHLPSVGPGRDRAIYVTGTVPTFIALPVDCQVRGFRGATWQPGRVLLNRERHLTRHVPSIGFTSLEAPLAASGSAAWIPAPTPAASCPPPDSRTQLRAFTSVRRRP
jgi:hypothetical protein